VPNTERGDGKSLCSVKHERHIKTGRQKEGNLSSSWSLKKHPDVKKTLKQGRNSRGEKQKGDPKNKGAHGEEGANLHMTHRLLTCLCHKKNLKKGEEKLVHTQSEKCSKRGKKKTGRM